MLGAPTGKREVPRRQPRVGPNHQQQETNRRDHDGERGDCDGQDQTGCRGRIDVPTQQEPEPRVLTYLSPHDRGVLREARRDRVDSGPTTGERPAEETGGDCRDEDAREDHQSLISVPNSRPSETGVVTATFGRVAIW